MPKVDYASKGICLKKYALKGLCLKGTPFDSYAKRGDASKKYALKGKCLKKLCPKGTMPLKTMPFYCTTLVNPVKKKFCSLRQEIFFLGYT